jgi:two-component system OmpR family response regulator
MAHEIAIVEDETSLRENYVDVLRRQGYQVQGYADRHCALRAFSQRLPDLVILDIGLNDDNEGGFELCRELRSQSRTLPIIFLTARNSDLDTISGLRLGADDYLTKDISLPHLSARIAALFRRTEALKSPAEVSETIVHHKLMMDMNLMKVFWDNVTLDITLTEHWIIYSLIKHPGHVKTRDQIMSEANIVVDDTTITSHIKRIRRKFRAIDPDFDCIETVYGMGYRWNDPNKG